MAIVNRDKDTSEQRDVYFYSNPLISGTSSLINLAASSCGQQLLVVASQAFGVSGSPIVGLQVQRFVVGSGLTTIPLNGSSLLTISALSSSGIQIHSLPTGSSLLLLQKGDMVQAVTSGANTAAVYAFECVLLTIQDLKQNFGV